MPLTITKKGNQKFGFSENKKKTPLQRLVSIPFAALNKPKENSKHGHHLEILNYTIQAALASGITEDAFSQILELMQQEARTALRKNTHLTSVDKTEIGKIFSDFSSEITLASLLMWYAPI